MSIFTKLKSSSSTGIINALFGALNAGINNPFWTKDDVHNQFPYDIVAFSLNQTEREAPVLTFSFGTGYPTTNATACRPGTCPYKRTDGSIFCTSAACKWVGDFVSDGVYRITMGEAPKHGYVVMMTPPRVVTTRFVIVQESATTFLVKTHVNAVLTNGLLDGDIIEVKLLNY